MDTWKLAEMHMGLGSNGTLIIEKFICNTKTCYDFSIDGRIIKKREFSKNMDNIADDICGKCNVKKEELIEALHMLEADKYPVRYE